MTIEELQAQQHEALCYLNVVRRCRDVVLQDITNANIAGERVAQATLDLADTLSTTEMAAVNALNNVYRTLDRKRAELAGIAP